jgi:hypothetical protein
MMQMLQACLCNGWLFMRYTAGRFDVQGSICTYYLGIIQTAACLVPII